MDDILLAAPKDSFDRILTTFNSFHKRLQFTIEIGNNNIINFLDTSVILENGTLFFDWFQKPTSGRYLNYHSHHPISHKKGIIIGLTDRIVMLSHPRFHEKNLTKAIKILLDNCYPLDFIFNTIRDRLKKLLFKNDHNINVEVSENNNNKKWFTVPFTDTTSREFSSIIRNCNFRLAFSIPNNLKNFIKTGKDPLDTSSHCNVVYRISCNDCEASYVGQTKRQLNTRLKEHKSDIKRSTSPSVISKYLMDCEHSFDWNNAKILDEEQVYNKRLISEMLHIKRQKFGLNRQSDTENLPDVYLPVLNLLPQL